MVRFLHDTSWVSVFEFLERTLFVFEIFSCNEIYLKCGLKLNSLAYRNCTVTHIETVQFRTPKLYSLGSVH